MPTLTRFFSAPLAEQHVQSAVATVPLQGRAVSEDLSAFHEPMTYKRFEHWFAVRRMMSLAADNESMAITPVQAVCKKVIERFMRVPALQSVQVDLFFVADMKFPLFESVHFAML